MQTSFPDIKIRTHTFNHYLPSNSLSHPTLTTPHNQQSNHPLIQNTLIWIINYLNQ